MADEKRFRVRMEGELTAELRELSAEQIAHLYDTLGAGVSGIVLTSRGLALSLARYGDKQYEPKDFIGASAVEREIVNPRHMQKLRTAWDHLHGIKEEDVADIKAMTPVGG